MKQLVLFLVAVFCLTATRADSSANGELKTVSCTQMASVTASHADCCSVDHPSAECETAAASISGCCCAPEQLNIECDGNGKLTFHWMNKCYVSQECPHSLSNRPIYEIQVTGYFNVSATGSELYGGFRPDYHLPVGESVTITITCGHSTLRQSYTRTSSGLVDGCDKLLGAATGYITTSMYQPSSVTINYSPTSIGHTGTYRVWVSTSSEFNGGIGDGYSSSGTISLSSYELPPTSTIYIKIVPGDGVCNQNGRKHYLLGEVQLSDYSPSSNYTIHFREVNE